MASARRGLTLVEIMLSLIMAVIVVGGIYNILVTSQRLSRVQGERISLQSSVRAGSVAIAEELRGLSTVEGGTDEQNDIIAFGPSAITYRALRGMGFVCQTPGSTMIRMARSTFSGHRDPQAGRDEAYVFSPASPDVEARDAWVRVQIVSVATAAACPGGLGAGITLTLAAGAAVGLPEPGTPVRIMELMELRLYQSEGRSWLGARSVSSGEAIQPLIGPLTGSDGFTLEYLDGAGVATADRTRIKSVRATLRGITEERAGIETPIQEELVTQVALRNSVRQ